MSLHGKSREGSPRLASVRARTPIPPKGVLAPTQNERPENENVWVSRPAAKATVPYLEDPNTGAKLFESASIVEYLETVYTVGA